MNGKFNNDDVRNAIEIVVRQKFSENCKERIAAIGDSRIQNMLETVTNSREELVTRMMSKLSANGKYGFILGSDSSTFAVS